jgi:RHS repeat-associated protein
LQNRLTSVSGNGRTAAFIYDGVGRCVKRVLDGATTVFTYDQWTPIVEWDGSGNVVATNVYGLGDDEIVYRSAGSTQLFYKTDPMGNVKFLLDQNGTGIEKYKYDAFGSPSITDWSGNSRSNSAYGNRFMFTGRDYLSSLALYDMRNRVYDPNMGRFYQADPMGLQADPLNLYRFSGNNPLLGGDPSGLGFWDFLSTIGSALDQFSHWFISQGEQNGDSSNSSSDQADNPLGFDGIPPLGPLAGPLPWGYLGTTGTFTDTSYDGSSRSSSSTGAASISLSVASPSLSSPIAGFGSPATLTAKSLFPPHGIQIMDGDPRWLIPALNYLRMHPPSGAIVDDARTRGIFVIIKPFAVNRTSSDNVITWDSASATGLPNGGFRPPVLSFLHELGHGVLNPTAKNWFGYYKWGNDSDGWQNLEEYRVITTVETPAAQFFRKPTRFNHYGAGAYQFVPDPFQP